MSTNDPACARQSSKFGSDTSMWGLSLLVVLLPQDDELVLVRERQGLQKDGVDHREEPHGQPEAEGQGEGRRENEAGLPGQAAERVPQVLAALVQEAQTARLRALVRGASGRGAGEVRRLEGHVVPGVLASAIGPFASPAVGFILAWSARMSRAFSDVHPPGRHDPVTPRLPGERPMETQTRIALADTAFFHRQRDLNGAWMSRPPGVATPAAVGGAFSDVLASDACAPR